MLDARLMAIPLGEGAVLGLVQGITEFLPVSSDGHLALAQLLYGGDAELAQTVLLHVGTLVATLVVLRKRVWNAIEEGLRGLGRPALLKETPGGRDASFVALATVPTVLVGLALERQVGESFGSLTLFGACFLVSAVVVGRDEARAAGGEDDAELDGGRARRRRARGGGPPGAVAHGGYHCVAALARRGGGAGVRAVVPRLDPGRRVRDRARVASRLARGRGAGGARAGDAARVRRGDRGALRDAPRGGRRQAAVVLFLSGAGGARDAGLGVRKTMKNDDASKSPKGDVYAVIMAGGAGTRFWPASRETKPKQLLPLADPAGRESLLAATVRRIAPIVPAERVYIATGTKLVEATARDLPGVPRANLLAEPVARNTAPCIGWATATIARANPDALVMVLPSDHFITDEDGFRTVVAKALEAARKGYLTTIGIVPTRPETGYGYIEVGGAIAGLAGVSEVARFVEKPDRARAEAYVAGGKHLWNAGMFFFRAKEMASAIRRHLPELADGLAKIDAAALRGDEARELAATFPGLPSVSIDVGVMEKASRLAVVPGSFGWNDLGSWESAWELATKDAAGNAVPDGAITVDARGNLVRDLTTGGGPKRVYALVGVSDLVVVETDDAVLVMARDRAQDVKAVVTELKKRGDGRT